MMNAVRELKLTVLGSGTSSGVPTIGCDCAVCSSADPRDQRLRPSVLLEYEGRTVLIDTTPDFRQQALRARIRRIDAILFTHAHADHIMGLDDIRPFNFRQGRIPIFASPDTMEAIQRCFSYIFYNGNPESSIPQIEVHLLDGSRFELFGVTVVPVPLQHGRSRTYGFRIGNVAYLTDHNLIPESSLELLQGLDVLFLDALRHRPHPTHSTVERSLDYVQRLSPRLAVFTHICHELGHEETERTLPSHVRLAHDGMVIQAELPA